MELKSIIPPREIQDAMEKQMKAECERREAMLQAAANGKATKIIIPSELQGLAGLASTAKTVFETEDPQN